MGWLVPHIGTDGKTSFYAVYRDLQGRQRSAGSFTTERKANKAWQIAETAQESGKTAGDPKQGRMRLRAYVEQVWFPQHVIEPSTREGYTYLLNRYILDEFGHHRMREIMPAHIRSWVLKLQEQGVRPPTIRACKVILDAVFTTALNDQVTSLHPGRGVKTPPVVRKPQRIITWVQFHTIYTAIPSDVMRLLIETDIESGLRWGELTELRVNDVDLATGVLTVARTVVHLKSKDRPGGQKFVVKEYPKDKEWRHVGLARHLVDKLTTYITERGLGPEDLLFEMAQTTEPTVRTRPAVLPDPETLGLTDPNDKGRQYRHGTLSAYQAGKCRCHHCKDAIATYRANRRANGKDIPRAPRTVTTDGHIPNDWFRRNVWDKALATANLGFDVTPHGMRHAHASWLLAGGADLQVVKERLGHGSIATTEKYLHTLPGAHDAALTALATIRGDLSPTMNATTGDANHPASQPTDTTTTPDAELATLREMVAKMGSMLNALGGAT